MVGPKGPFSSLPDTAGAPRQIPGWDPSTNKHKPVGVPRGPGVRRGCIVCMGPMTPPVDSRAPVCARLDRVRLRVLGEPRGICAIRPCARDLCACVCPGARAGACACVYARVQACACAVYYSRVCVNKTCEFVRMVVAIAWGIDSASRLRRLCSPATSRQRKHRTEN